MAHLTDTDLSDSAPEDVNEEGINQCRESISDEEKIFNLVNRFVGGQTGFVREVPLEEAFARRIISKLQRVVRLRLRLRFINECAMEPC